MDRNLKFHEHMKRIAERAAGLANQLLRTTENRESEFMMPLFITHVRPLLDFCSCVLNVGYVGDVALLKSVQRRWTKNIRGMMNLTYEKRLRSLNLISIKGKLLHADLIKY